VSTRRYTVTQSDGSFAFDQVPVGDYQGATPVVPRVGVAEYLQPTGTYALALASSGLGFERDDPASPILQSVRAYPAPAFRSDPHHYLYAPLHVAARQDSSLGDVVLSPVLTASTQVAEAGIDLAAGRKVARDAPTADVWVDWQRPTLSVNADAPAAQLEPSGNFQALAAPSGTTFAERVEIDLSAEVDWAQYPDLYNRVISVRTRTGRYFKLKLLPACETYTPELMVLWRCYDVLYQALEAPVP
jgi:hypothetical protein